MNARRYLGGIVPAAVLLVTALVTAGCGASGTVSAGAPGVPGSVPPAAGSAPAGSAPPGSAVPVPPGSPGGPPTPGLPAGPPVRPGGPAVPVPVSALVCGTSPAVRVGSLPDRDFTQVAWCPLAVGGVQLNTPVQQDRGAPVMVRGDLGPLVAALRLPDAPRSTGVCPLYRVQLPQFWLVDGAGEAYQPWIPVGPCGQPATAVTDAMRALGLH